MKKDELILAVDLGTSGPKVGLFTLQGESLGYEVELTPVQLRPGGGAEQDPADWWNAIVRATRRLLARGLAPVQNIIAFSCTTQWAGTVPVDRNGEPLMNAIIWMDSRGAPYVRRITGGPVEFEGYGLDKLLTWVRLTGGIPGHAGKDSIAHILWLKHERPEVYNAAYKFLEPMDYINLKLTGRFAASHATIQITWITDNRDINHIRYDPGLLKLSTIDPDKLPELKGCTEVLGPLKPQIAAELGLPDQVQVVTGTSDMASAAIGSGAVRDYQPNLYIGTSSWLMCHVPYKKTDLFHNQASIPSGIPGKYILTNEQECAGACLNYLRDNVLFHPEQLVEEEGTRTAYQAFDRMADRVTPGSDRVLFTPWLYGERTPVEDHLVRGSFTNLSLHTTREHLVRAVLEGVAFNTRWLLGGVESFIGRRLDSLPLIGGGANSKTWCQIFADALNRPIKQLKDPALCNARGAAYLAAVAIGRLQFDDIPQLVQVDCTYQPNPVHRAFYDEMFRQFVAIYRSNGKIYRALNGGRLGQDGRSS